MRTRVAGGSETQRADKPHAGATDRMTASPAGRSAATRSAVGHQALAAGNQTVQRLLQHGVIRPTLRVGAADDPEEREADRLAHAVVNGSGACTCAGGAPCARCGGPASGSIRRKPERREERAAASMAGTLSLAGARPLRESERSFFEPRFGVDLGAVRVHTGSATESAAASIAARAFTLGSDIGFAAGQLNPDSSEGRLLMAHELAHVTLNHAGIRRITDFEIEARAAAAERRRREAEESRRRHEEWSRGVDAQFGRDLANQSGTAGEERDRIDLALTAQRAAALEAVAGGEGWLQEALTAQGYSGPGLADVKQRWAEALVAAETVKLGASTGTVTSEARLAALEAIPPFYEAASEFTRAAEEAHRTRVQAENDRRHAEYRTRLAAYEQRERLERASYGPRGEPGEGAFRAGLAIARGPRPEAPAQLTAPPAISGQIAPARARVYAADTTAEWQAVAGDVNRVANGFATLVVASLPVSADVRVGLEHLEALNVRLATLEQEHPLAVRIPAVFYPNDRTVSRPEEGGGARLVPEAIPWQFYLINTGVASHDQPARAGGEWVLIDLTSTQRFENRAPASDFDSARLQQGAVVDPPIELFSELNSRIRFPEGRLFFTLPSGTSYTLRTTEPWSVSDWLTAVGIALAAIALVASVVATGGASAPAAVAFYAGLGAAAAGIGSTLANLHERSQQGILTSADIDRAMVSIAIDIVTAASMGLGRLVALPGAAARIGVTGERFIALQRATQVARAGALGGDLYHAWSFTSGLVSSLRAIDTQPGLSDEERSRMRAQLVRRALLTGALMAIAIRGDVADIQAGRQLRVSHVDADGALHAADPAAPREHAGAPGAAPASRAAPHADITAPVHAGAQRSGSGVAIGPQSHAVGAAGTGRSRDFYFCSDLCAPIVNRLLAVLAAMPRNHPFRPAVQDMLSRARTARRQLKAGQMTQADADAVASALTERIGRLSADSQHFGALMNTDPALLAAHAPAIRQRLAEAVREQTAHLGIQAERQAASRGARGREPLAEPEPTSPLETDLLGGIAIQNVERPGRRAQPLHFDTGNFSHTHAEALVPGLPRGLHSEVRVTKADGTVGRADRVRFIYDADGDRIGAHVFEVKPNTADNIARGQTQAQEYVDALRTEIQDALRAKGKTVPTTAPDGGPLFTGQVVTYDYERMLAVMRALRTRRRDAARMAEYEAVAREVFGAAPPAPAP